MSRPSARLRLLAVLVAVLLAFVYLVAFGSMLVVLSQPYREAIPPQRPSELWIGRDPDLLSPYQREQARETGRAAIEWNGTVCVLENLPEEYLD